MILTAVINIWSTNTAAELYRMINREVRLSLLPAIVIFILRTVSALRLIIICTPSTRLSAILSRNRSRVCFTDSRPGLIQILCTLLTIMFSVCPFTSVRPASSWFMLGNSSDALALEPSWSRRGSWRTL